LLNPAEIKHQDVNGRVQRQATKASPSLFKKPTTAKDIFMTHPAEAFF